MVGKQVAHYRVEEKLGEGGMGEVYRARDTRLNRDVALKILPQVFAQDSERMARFEREAQVLASLNHSNIAQIYGLEEMVSGPETRDSRHSKAKALVLELVPGETLQEQIARGPIPVDDAVKIALQICEGLEAAHEKGIIHRDLKPANIKITPEGQVKILDFGLAKALEGEVPASEISHSPTISHMATQEGVILGTVAYMSPEQARGQPVDKRTDIWAFGCVVYEMLTGKRLFQGEDPVEVLANVVKTQPETRTVPKKFRRLLEKCLEKDSGIRLRDISGVQLLLEEPEPPPNSEAKSNILPWILLSVAASFVFVLTYLHFRETTPEVPLRRFTLTSPIAVDSGDTTGNHTLAISPNGKHIVFVEEGSQGRLWVQDLSQNHPRMLDGTKGAWAPFWSPDSRFIGFAVPGEVRKILAEGGPPIPICKLPAGINRFRGGTWSPDGEVVVFSSGKGGLGQNLYEVPSKGGTASLLIEARDFGESATIRWSHFLPTETGSRVLAFTVTRTGMAQATIMVRDLESGIQTELGPGILPVYSPSGHLVYQSDRNTFELWAVPFSLNSFRVTGQAFRIAKNSRYPAVALDGTLAYQEIYGSRPERLYWQNRDGLRLNEVGVEFDEIGDFALSPDEKYITTAAKKGANWDIWVHEIELGSRHKISTAELVDSTPVWSPDGDQIAFSSTRMGDWDIWLRQADGTGKEEPLVIQQGDQIPSSWSYDGRYLTYESRMNLEDDDFDLWYLERSDDGENWTSHLFLEETGNQRAPQLSPNSRYVAYTSDESGQWEVYIQPFPEGGRRVTVSSNGGIGHLWSVSGRELFYINRSEMLVAVEVFPETEFSTGRLVTLFDNPGKRSRLLPGYVGAPYDVSEDGQQFLVAELVEGNSPPPSIRVVQNWYEEFKHLAPKE